MDQGRGSTICRRSCDELVLFQRGIDFRDHGGAHAFAADLPQRLERVRLSAQETGLGGGQGGHHGRQIGGK